MSPETPGSISFLGIKLLMAETLETSFEVERASRRCQNEIRVSHGVTEVQSEPQTVAFICRS